MLTKRFIKTHYARLLSPYHQHRRRHSIADFIQNGGYEQVIFVYLFAGIFPQIAKILRACTLNRWRNRNYRFNSLSRSLSLSATELNTHITNGRTELNVQQNRYHYNSSKKIAKLWRNRMCTEQKLRIPLRIIMLNKWTKGMGTKASNFHPFPFHFSQFILSNSFLFLFLFSLSLYEFSLSLSFSLALALSLPNNQITY